jgi:SPP1 family predicted phage head-tail adaptor
VFSGALDRRIAIKRATISQDDFGQGVKSWATLATVWASRKPISDAERVQSGEITAEAQCRFQIRYSSTVADVNPKDRIEYDGMIYEIWGVKEIGRRVGLEISATALADLIQAAPMDGNTLIWGFGNSLEWGAGNQIIWG